MIEIIWNESMRPQNKAEIEKYLIPWLWLMPSWAQRLHINLYDSDDKDGEAIAETITDFAYRFIRINIFTCWLNVSDSDKPFYLVHELIHGFCNSSYHQARRTIKILAADNQQLKTFSLDELSATNEAQVCDLTRAIYDKFKQ